MKNLSKEQLSNIAENHGAELIDDLMPSLDFGGYGFEATEDYDGKYSGFRFFGDSRKQAELLPVWNELTEDNLPDDQLTLEVAKELIGKKVEIYYYNSMKQAINFTIEVVAIEKKPSNQIGQSEEHELHFIVLKDDLDRNPDGSIKTFIYEWQGIFRVTGSAHLVYVRKSL